MRPLSLLVSTLRWVEDEHSAFRSVVLYPPPEGRETEVTQSHAQRVPAIMDCVIAFLAYLDLHPIFSWFSPGPTPAYPDRFAQEFTGVGP